MSKSNSALIAIACVGVSALVFAHHEKRSRSPSSVVADGRNDQLAASSYPQTGLSSVSSADIYAEGGTIHALVSGTLGADPKQQLRYLRSEDGGATWQQPRAIETGTAAPYNPDTGNSVQIAASGNRLLAAWETKGSGWSGYGPIVTARSEDDGRSWQSGTHPDESVVGSEQSFIDLTADGDGILHIVWLDGRPAAKGGDAAVAYAASADHGLSWGKAVTIDGTTCTCCANKIVAGPDGRVSILYRDGKPRDMSLAHSRNGGADWSPARPAGEFDWAFAGCPHVGGGLVDTGTALHATVWTGRQDMVGLYHTASRDGGGTWSAPLRLGGETARHSDIGYSAADGLVAVWDETRPDGSAILAARSRDDGQSWDAPLIVLRHSEDILTHPRVVATHAGFRAFWIEERGQQARLATEVISIPN